MDIRAAFLVTAFVAAALPALGGAAAIPQSPNASPTPASSPSATVSPSATNAPSPAASGAPAAGNAVTGKEVFANNCATCHGDKGEGGYGPSLKGASVSWMVQNVRHPGGGMPKLPLSDAELADVAAFIATF